MTEDRIERQMASIIEQQAKNTVNIAALQESQRQLQEGQQQLQQGHRELQEGQRELQEHIHSLADALLSLTNIVEKHEGRFVELLERGKETDARLNSLIAVVERHIPDHGTREAS